MTIVKWNLAEIVEYLSLILVVIGTGRIYTVSGLSAMVEYLQCTQIKWHFNMILACHNIVPDKNS